MKLHNIGAMIIAILLISYITLKVFTDMFQTSFSESFLIEFILIIGLIGSFTFLSWKSEENEHY
ncbi:hypothetical protein KP77_28900 [Jeotgalibacillus alimentarius]|uniref:Uncharacterized protein n=2 Tax=Jeotgalibacillus TaxID=157226 RepID=A0A0C2RSD9_9BACL|nr:MULTISPECIES: hypothetical protein [Jeotgalibacillus]KIL44669.1 hypothetical protein KP77_28900 [Jeotgalibacillus alimentarius]MBM7577903.1 hypothetical protein [Jeotgalibacillus terrae]